MFLGTITPDFDRVTTDIDTSVDKGINAGLVNLTTKYFVSIPKAYSDMIKINSSLLGPFVGRD